MEKLTGFVNSLTSLLMASTILYLVVISLS